MRHENIVRGFRSQLIWFICARDICGTRKVEKIKGEQRKLAEPEAPLSLQVCREQSSDR